MVHFRITNVVVKATIDVQVPMEDIARFNLEVVMQPIFLTMTMRFRGMCT